MRNGGKLGCGEGFKAGVTTWAVATVLFTVFFAVYSTELNSSFLTELSEVWSKDYKNFEGIVFFTVAIMGIATSLVLTSRFRQLFKSCNNPKK